MNTKLFAALFALVLLAGLLQDRTARAADSIVLRAAGCKTEYFLLQELAAAYRAKSGTRLHLGNTGNKKAVDLLMENKIDQGLEA